MDITLTKLVLFLALLSIGVNQLASAVESDVAEEIFCLAQQKFPQFFSPPLSTQNFRPDWPYYRGPYNNNIYVGINADEFVYVIGGDFGDTLLRVGTAQEILTSLQNTESNGGATTENTCNTLPTGNYRIAINGQVTFSGVPASPPFTRDATLVVVPTVDPLNPSLTTNNGVNPVDVGIFTDDSPIIGFAGALYFGSNTSLSSLVGSTLGSSAIDIAFVEAEQSTGRVTVVIDGNAFGLPNARLNTFNIFNARTSITTQIQTVLAGTVILNFVDNGDTINGSINLGGTSGFGGVGITTEYTATFAGTRIQ